MKKWLVFILLVTFIITEMGCVVRVKERSRPAPPPSRIISN